MGLTIAGRGAGWRSTVCGAALLMLAGCEGFEGGTLSKAGPEASEPSGETRAASPLAQRDVEAPQVFRETDRGLWDGRPSLGGVWVAHPDVTEPERVLIRNTATSESVVGALFRRERANPGPAFQVSSEAAAALGMLAGAPAELTVTALRREATPEQVETSSLEPAADTAEPRATRPPARAAAAPPPADAARADTD